MRELSSPYLIFFGDEERATYAKTGLGVAQWRRELCVGQLRMTSNTADAGLPDYTIEQAHQQGARSVLLGVALVGGSLPSHWIPLLVQALELGMDVVAGFHTRLTSFPELVQAAERGGAQLIDVRVPPEGIPVGTGKKRSGKRLLTVGTDCALGKKYTALALAEAMAHDGFDVDFRATGQTGIMIAGSGIPMDAVVSDFLVGAAELLSPEADPDHWDVIEGQGALFHPGYAPVSMGLLIGSQPDAFVVCTEAGRGTIRDWDDFPAPDIKDVIDRTIDVGRQYNDAIRCVGISANTMILGDSERRAYLDGLTQRYELPAVDPLQDAGVQPIVQHLRSQQWL